MGAERGAAAGRAPEPLTLSLTAGPAAGAEYRAAPGVRRLAVGRTRASFVWVKDKSVSERHAEVVWNDAEGGGWEVRDLGSSNGTWLNGEEVVEGGAPRPLRDGDSLEFGPDSKASVRIENVNLDSLSVEQFILKECDRLCKDVQAKQEECIAQIREFAQA